MPLDLFGPASAQGAVTLRPGDTRSFGTADTFFKDCSSPEVDDGTEFQAAWFNQILANWRSLARGNGLTAGGSQIVTEDNADDAILLKAVQHLIQRGLPSFAIDTGAPNELVASLSPALAEYKLGVRCLIKVSNDTTLPNPSVNINALGAKTIKHLDGSPIIGGEVRAGMIMEIVYDGTSFLWISQPFSLAPPLAANRDYYVNGSIGSDAYDGLSSSAGHPFLTIGRAIAVASALNLNGYQVTIHVANGTYPENLQLPVLNGNGTVVIVGDEATPNNVHVNPAAGPAVNWGEGFAVFGWKLRGLKLSGAVNGARVGCGIYGGAGGVTIRNIDFGTAAFCHMFINGGGILTIDGAASGAPGAKVRTSGNAGTAHMYSLAGSFINIYQPDLIVGSQSFGAFALAEQLSLIGGTYSSITGAGSVSSTTKYDVKSNSIIHTNGAGINYFPGTSAGSEASGGRYI